MLLNNYAYYNNWEISYENILNNRQLMEKSVKDGNY